ncbi:hypothetical protein OUZ56_021369 [Daphnia magna]|uniref:Uncharacterized protein n=1 Tax=Daphnia magna TaxID=35525 RepID=A0ABQ9ZH58_9CRUS|nr:hypothetical protein OUZ56_021369 [Daphnia magna]
MAENNQFKNRPTSLLEGDFTSPVGPMEASTPMDDSIYMDSFFRTDESIYMDSSVRIVESIYVDSSIRMNPSMDVDASTLPSNNTSMYVDSDSGEPPQIEGMDASSVGFATVNDRFKLRLSVGDYGANVPTPNDY